MRRPREPDPEWGDSGVSAEVVSHSRAIQIGLAILIAAAVIGFFTGTQEEEYEAPPVTAGAPPPAPAHWEDIEEAPSYTMRSADQRSGPNRDWISSLADLEYDLPDPFSLERSTSDQRSEAVALRVERRSFEGAPPVIPHPTTQMGSLSCLGCHRDGIVIGDLVAPAMSHETMDSCTQCHVEQRAEWVPVAAVLPPLTSVPNAFEGLESPGDGLRAWPGAPPTIPHTVLLRENCASCHGLHAPEGLRSSHPWRGSCQQCHVLETGLSQWARTTQIAHSESVPPWAVSTNESP